jgi:hypothetical protein
MPAKPHRRRLKIRLPLGMVLDGFKFYVEGGWAIHITDFRHYCDNPVTKEGKASFHVTRPGH